MLQFVLFDLLGHGWFVGENCCGTECCREVAGIPRVGDLVVIVVVGWFIIILFYDSDSEEWCSSLARLCIKRLNCWSLILLCSGIRASIVLASSTPSLLLIPALLDLGVVLSDIFFLLLGS